MAFVNDCHTADDVRRNAQEVWKRARARDERLRAAAQARAVMDDMPPKPDPVPQPDEIKPKHKRPSQISDEQLIALLRDEPQRVHGLIAQMEQGAEIITSVRQVQDAVCLAFGITRLELIGVSHRQCYVQPRQTSYLLCKLLTLHSLPLIGRLHGGRDHTTVLHGIRKLEWLRKILVSELSETSPVEAWAARSKFHVENRAG